MKFKKGSRVEVLRKTHLSSCAWRCGEIISGNGQTYWVRYDVLWGLSNEDDVESVSREVIRPCPPPADVSDGWAVGDLVEVFNNLCWKTAAVMKVMRGNRCLVRLIGSSTELRVDKVNIRMRQLWQDGRWVEIGKVRYIPFFSTVFLVNSYWFPYLCLLSLCTWFVSLANIVCFICLVGLLSSQL
jgi:hypothetical protein